MRKVSSSSCHQTLSRTWREKRLSALVSVFLLAWLLSLVIGFDGGISKAAGHEARKFPADSSQVVADVEEPRSVDVDVIVFSTQTSGLAAVRELVLGAPHLRVALVSAGNLLETPLAQGLSVEDAREVDQVLGGFYAEWRQAVINSYALRGIKPFRGSSRLVYEPEIAAKVLWSYLQGPNRGNVTFYSARLVGACDQGDSRYADIETEGGGVLRLNTRFFIDASVEADLARMLGASYRIGRHETDFNDLSGAKPAYPTASNGYETAPQRFSPLLTLKVYPRAAAPRVSNLAHPSYYPATYSVMPALSQNNVAAFKNSWSMRIAVLPNGKHELNESWNDCPDVGLAFEWIFSPEKRGEIRRRVLEWSINRIRYLQEHGYPNVGVAAVPQKLYVREGPRVVGLDTYTVEDLRGSVVRNPVALGCYVEYDRHDGFYPNHVEQTRYASLPMEALMASEHPWLLVSTAVSTDCAAYCSAVRMEHMRAAMGGAAGTIVVVADRLRLRPDQVPYTEVRSRLLERGYRLLEATRSPSALSQ